MATKKKRKNPESQSAAQLRGVETFDTEERVVLVLADVERTAGALVKHTKAKTWLRDVLGQSVTVSEPSYLVLRLRDHPWSAIVACTGGPRSILGQADAKSLAKAMKTKAIFFANSDCASATEYELFDAAGKSREWFRCVEEVELKSDLRKVDPPEDGPDVYEFIDRFMREQDAFVPPWSIVLNAGGISAGQEVELTPEDELPGELMERMDVVAVAGSSASGQKGKPQQAKRSKADRREADLDLHSAIENRRVEDVKRLLDEGGDPNALDDAGRYAMTALCAAINRASDNALDISAKMSAAMRRKFERAAVRAEALQIIKLLLDAGADSNRATATRTPLGLAAEGGDAEVARMLLESGADPAGPSWSPLSKLPRPKGGLALFDNAIHSAAREGFADVVQLLLAHGADPSATDHEGKTALDHAIEHKHAKIQKILRDAAPKRTGRPRTKRER